MAALFVCTQKETGAFSQRLRANNTNFNFNLTMKLRENPGAKVRENIGIKC